MNRKSRPRTRLTTAQIVLMIVLLSALALYNYYSSKKNTPTPQPSPAVTLNVTRPADVTEQPAAQPTSPAAQMSEFDYFVLALSWSPDYCATSGGDDPQQCSIGKKFAFVLHGLWPQYERGYPSDCSTQKLPASVKAQFPGLYPSDALYDHEWEKHGTCTGLAPADYLALSRQIKSSVVIPDAYKAPSKTFRSGVDELKQAFLAANPQFSADTLGVFCSGSGRYLKEIQVCFDRDGQPRACSAEVLKSASKSCQAAEFTVRNVR